MDGAREACLHSCRFVTALAAPITPTRIEITQGAPERAAVDDTVKGACSSAVGGVFQSGIEFLHALLLHTLRHRVLAAGRVAYGM